MEVRPTSTTQRIIMAGTLMLALAGCSDARPTPSAPKSTRMTEMPQTPQSTSPRESIPGPSFNPECISGIKDLGLVALNTNQIHEIEAHRVLPDVVESLTHGAHPYALLVEFPVSYHDLSHAEYVSAQLAEMIHFQYPDIQIVQEPYVPDGEVIARTAVLCGKGGDLSPESPLPTSGTAI